MEHKALFNKELISRYNLTGPRYTSYPSAVKFHEGFGLDEYNEVVNYSNEEIIPTPLSLYIHLPFCNTVCFYCACNKIITANRQRAVPYLKNLHKEIAMQGKLFDYDRVVNQLHFGGGTPTYISQEQMHDLMQTIKQNFNLLNDDSGEYSIEIDPREVDSETIKSLRMLGFNRMSIGVQDFNVDVQEAINRKQSYEQTRSVFDTARQHQFHSINIDLIYGLPKQNSVTFCDTVKKVIDMGPERIAIYNYAHLPHMFKTQRQIQEPDLPKPDEKLNILSQSIELLESAGYVYIGMDHFARPDDALAIAQRNQSLYRNFQGYSTNSDCDIVGMGVTAISKINNSYSQNYRTLEEYYDALEGDRIPVFRGYRLNADDELRLHLITQLICHFEINYREIEDLFKINFNDYFADELSLLKTMEDDELLVLNNETIQILPAGRFLIRNICSVFDVYLPRDSKTQHFSKMI